MSQEYALAMATILLSSAVQMKHTMIITWRKQVNSPSYSWCGVACHFNIRGDSNHYLNKQPRIIFFIPSIENCFGDNKVIFFLDDNASYHWTKRIKAFPQEIQIESTTRPAKSPYLNLIKNLWEIFKGSCESFIHQRESIKYHLEGGKCPWCNGYRRRIWTRRHEFKSWTRLIAFHIALIPLGKVRIQLFSLQLLVNSRAD